MRQRSAVVFPAPLRPTRVAISPASARRVTPRSAWASPYQAERPVTSSIDLPEVRAHHRGVLANGRVRTLRDHLALLQHDDIVRELADHAHVVLDEHDG